jgi:hypothetical protein
VFGLDRNPLAILFGDWLRPHRVLACLLGALGFVAAYVPQVSAQVNKAERVQWIDVHVHLIGGRGSYTDYDGAVKLAVSAMQESGIAKMILMPPPQVDGITPPFDFENFITAAKPYGSRLAFLGGSGSLKPMIQESGRQPTVSDRLRIRFEERATEILKAGALGFGEITAHHLSLLSGHPYEAVPADHPLLRLLVDIAGRHDVVIDLHFDPVVEEMKAPEWLRVPPNPPVFQPNMTAFERLLEHNRRAKIVWAHAGSDILGHWTVSLSLSLLQKHSNLYMSLRMGPGRAPQNHPLTPKGEIKPEWIQLLNEFPDRFVIGGDQFFAVPGIGQGPGTVFAQRAGTMRQRINMFLDKLPEGLARKIARDNATRLYKLKE